MGLEVNGNPWTQELFSTGIPLYSFSLTPLTTSEKVAEAWRGDGRVILEDESIYEGRLLNGKPHGHGKRTFRSGDIYTGEWEKGNINGQGTMNAQNGSLISGEWSKNVLHGNVFCRSKQGDSIEGEMKHGKVHGFAVRRFLTGEFYSGIWNRDILVEIHEMEMTKTCLSAASSVEGKNGAIFFLAIACFNKAFPVIAEIYPESKQLFTDLKNSLTHLLHIGEIMFIPTGWQDHNLMVVIHKDLLLICNRGEGMEKHSTRVFRIRAEKVTQELIYEIFMAAKKLQKVAMPYIYGELLKSLDAQQDKKCLELEKALTTGPQKVGNCWWASCKEAIKGALALLFLQQGMSIEEATNKAKELKKLCSTIARLQLLHEYRGKVASHEIQPLEEPLVETIKSKTMKAYRKCAESLDSLSPEEYPWVMEGRR